MYQRHTRHELIKNSDGFAFRITAEAPGSDYEGIHTETFSVDGDTEYHVYSSMKADAITGGYGWFDIHCFDGSGNDIGDNLWYGDTDRSINGNTEWEKKHGFFRTPSSAEKCSLYFFLDPQSSGSLSITNIKIGRDSDNGAPPLSCNDNRVCTKDWDIEKSKSGNYYFYGMGKAVGGIVKPSENIVKVSFNGGGAISRKSYAYIYANGMLISRKSVNEDNFEFYHLDRNNNIIAITDENGDVVGDYGYTPYGRTEIISVESSDNKLQYKGGYYEDDVDLHRLDRLYNDKSSVYVTPAMGGENVWNPQTYNQYSYQLNNPLNKIEYGSIFLPSPDDYSRPSTPPKASIPASYQVVYEPYRYLSGTSFSTSAYQVPSFNILDASLILKREEKFITLKGKDEVVYSREFAGGGEKAAISADAGEQGEGEFSTSLKITDEISGDSGDKGKALDTLVKFVFFIPADDTTMTGVMSENNWFETPEDAYGFLKNSNSMRKIHKGKGFELSKESLEYPTLKKEKKLTGKSLKELKKTSANFVTKNDMVILEGPMNVADIADIIDSKNNNNQNAKIIISPRPLEIRMRDVGSHTFRLVEIEPPKELQKRSDYEGMNMGIEMQMALMRMSSSRYMSPSRSRLMVPYYLMPRAGNGGY
ncbi:MAG: hypothetical protein GXO64_04260 [Candidatus Micrarchaeota archaeon]|nr:hypothetical protein [Candidatus Micrarchaeota archaeon]